MKIRSAKKRDLPNIASLHIQSWRDAYAGILPPAFLGNPLEEAFTRYWRDVDLGTEDVVLVAENGGICGFIAVWCRPTPYIDNLHVSPPLRSKNIGKTLLISAAHMLLDRGHSRAYLWVFERNQMAIHFYERMGGLVKEKAPQDIFGHSIPSLKIEWKDLTVIIDGSTDARLADSKSDSD